MKLVLASGNRGKLAELQALLGDAGFELVTQRDLGIGDADETGLTFVENALLKARHAARISGMPALADDSGLCVDALDGAPGLYSARYSGPGASDAANRARLLDALSARPPERRRGYFICVLVLLRHADDPAPLIAEARWHGAIAPAERGAHGFGYDPVFVPDGCAQTAAELDPAIKNVRSHRGQALARLVALLPQLQFDS